MLSNFIRRNGKRKGNKINESSSHQKSHSASSSLASSSVFNISEESSSQSVTQSPRLAKLILSHSNEEWFPEELLRSRSYSPAPSPRRAQNAAVTRNNSTQETHADSSSILSPGRSENVPRVVFRKKLIPAPILIPGADLLMSNIQIGCSAVPSAVLPIETSQPITNHASLNSPSPSTSDNLSAISGTTLPHALIGSSFVLSSTERCSSRRRSGVVRQDSATLPRGEVGFLFDSGKPSFIPALSPVPAMLAPSKQDYPSPVKSGTSTESEYPMSDAYTTPPEIVVGSVIRQQTSFTQEIPSPAASTSTEASPSVVSSTASQRKASLVPARTRIAKNGVFSDVPKTVVEASLTLPVNSLGTTQHSSQQGSDLHGLDEFDFVPPASTCPNSHSSTSRVAPLLPKRSDPNRGQRKRRVGGSSLVWDRCTSGTPKFKPENFFTAKDNSLAGGIPTSHQGYGMPSATISEHDYGELLNCDLTLSPESSASSHIPSSASAGYQTFPETPIVFSPLWSPGYALLAKPDSQVLRRRPQSPKSAGLRSGKLYSSMRTTRRQLDNKDGAGGAVVLRRSQSSVLPGKQALSPKQAESRLLPSAQIHDGARIPEETNQSLTASVVESRSTVEAWSAVRPHPLAHVSPSSSCLSEEEALRALAPHSASSLPSLITDNVDASFSLMTMPASVIDSSGKSPTSVPLPDSTDGSPFNSPPLTDSVTGASPPTSPLQSSVPMTTAAVSSPFPSNSPFSAPSSSLWSSFLPSPSPPASLNEPLSQLLSPIVSPPAVLDELVSPFPSSVPPPPYHTIVSERTVHHPGSISTPSPSLSRTSSTEYYCQRSRQASNSPAASGAVRSRVRARPPLPIGPRKPSGPGQTLCSLVPGVRGRNGSSSSVVSGDPIGSPGSLWRKIQSAVSKPPPRFQPPPPKWRGLTLEAAQWTFTSAQLQEMVSRAIQQASEGSSLRLLRVEILDGEIADEMDRLELQHTDVKAQYKALVWKRWTLMGVLAGHIEGVEMNDVTTVSRTTEELAEVLMALDCLADKMHSIVLQMAQLRNLRDVHNASALAMAVRKINGLFVRQMAEKERLQGQVDTLQTERDEAWKYAEDIAQDYDTLNDRMSGTAFAFGDVRAHGETQSSAGSKRSTRISAVRKSSVRLSQAGLRSRGKHRSARSSSNATRPTSSPLEGIPPVPRLRVKPLSIGSTAFPTSTSKSAGSMYSSSSPTSDALALAEAQREVYEMLGLSLPPSQASSRRWTLSDPDPDLRPPSLSSRPISDLFTEPRARQQRRGRV